MCSPYHRVSLPSDMRATEWPANWQISTQFTSSPSIAPSSQLLVSNSPVDFWTTPSVAITFWTVCPEITSSSCDVLIASLDESATVSGTHTLRLLTDRRSISLTFGDNGEIFKFKIAERLEVGDWFNVVWQIIPGPKHTRINLVVNGVILTDPTFYTLSPLIPPVLTFYRTGNIAGTQDVRYMIGKDSISFIVDQTGIQSIYGNGLGMPYPIPYHPDAWYKAMDVNEHTITNTGSNDLFPGATLVSLANNWTQGALSTFRLSLGMPELALGSGEIVGQVYMCSPPTKMCIYYRNTIDTGMNISSVNTIPSFASVVKTDTVQTEIEVKLGFNSSMYTFICLVVAAISLEESVIELQIPDYVSYKGDITFSLGGFISSMFITAINKVEFK
jgi:hypothetical protein